MGRVRPIHHPTWAIEPMDQRFDRLLGVGKTNVRMSYNQMIAINNSNGIRGVNTCVDLLLCALTCHCRCLTLPHFVMCSKAGRMSPVDAFVDGHFRSKNCFAIRLAGNNFSNSWRKNFLPKISSMKIKRLNINEFRSELLMQSFEAFRPKPELK